MEEWVSCFLRLERLNLAAAAEEKTSGRECAALVSELGLKPWSTESRPLTRTTSPSEGLQRQGDHTVTPEAQDVLMRPS